MESTETPEIVMENEPESGVTRIHLMLDGRKVSWLSIIPFTLHIGAATVRMDGIGGVGTEAEYRKRGYSRRVLEAAVDYMCQGDGALSMLYGIADFYPKFGYATSGPDYLILLNALHRDNTLPTGWSVRDFEFADLPAVQALYLQNTLHAAGAAQRPAEGKVWKHLAEQKDAAADACRVVLGPDGLIHGYVWRAGWCWYVKHKLESDYTEALVLGEAVADGPRAADAVLAACRQWGQEEGAQRTIRQVVLSLPPEGPLATAAMYQYARCLQNYSACGNSMARVLDVTRLLQALAPELHARLHATHSTFTGTLLIQTDLGDAALHISPQEVAVERTSDVSAEALRVVLPQTELARLALGAFPPEDLLSRLPQPPDETVAELLQALFPLRYPHMRLPDRY